MMRDISACPDVDRLAKICGLFSSDHAGERSTAAAKADALVRAAGLTWPDLLHGPQIRTPRPPPYPASPQASARELIQRRGWALTDWERTFLQGLTCWSGAVTRKQAATLDRIHQRLGMNWGGR